MAILKDFLGTIREIRHRSPQPKFCPSCGSHRMRQLPAMGIMPVTYFCEDCGYRGLLVLELEKEPEDQEKPD